MKRCIEERLRKALSQRPGPWEIETYTHTCGIARKTEMWTVYDRNTDLVESASKENAEYVVGLHDLMAGALAEIEQLRAQLAREQVEL